MNKYQKKKIKKKILITGAGIVVSVVVIKILSMKTMLPAYVGTEETTVETQAAINVDSSTVKDDTLGFSIEVPTGWDKITNEDGTTSYIHSPSSSYIDVITHDYFPSVNQYLSHDYVYSTITEIGGYLSDYKQINSSSIRYSYEYNTAGGTYDITKVLLWDFCHIVDVTVGINDKYKDRLANTVSYIAENVTWDNRKSPLDPQYYVYYSKAGNIQFGVPIAWNFELGETDILITDSSSNSSIDVSMNSGITDFSNVTQLQYTQLVAGTVSNFVLSSYSHTKDKIHAEATFTQNNVKMYMLQDMISDGTYYYTFTYTIPAANYNDSYKEIYNQCISYFKSFN